MFRVCALLIFAITSTLGYSLGDNEYLRFYLEPEDVEEVSIPIQIAEVNQDMKFRDQQGHMMHGDEIIAKGMKNTRSPKGAPATISTNFTYSGPKQAHYVDVRTLQSSPKHKVSVSRGVWNSELIITIESTATLYQNVTFFLYGQ